MRLTLINHASLIVEAGSVVIWTDPWLFGRAFNESWALSPAPDVERMRALLPRITHLYVSHEHPDHFHLPTLRWLPADFKDRVPVLFQRLHTEKMPEAFNRLGFKTIHTLAHREIREIAPGVRFYMFQSAPLDSAFGLIDHQGQVLFNQNDCELSYFDRAWIRKDLGKISILLNQFSIATYDGRINVSEVAPRHAARILKRMEIDHKGLDATISIPIASFMYFCCEDNCHLNAYRNSISTTASAYKNAGLQLVILRPFDTYETGQAHDNSPAVEYYGEMERSGLVLDPVKSVSSDMIENAATKCFDDLYTYYPRLLLRLIGKLRCWVPDIRQHYVLDFVNRKIWGKCSASDDWDIQLNSQPLWFALQQPYGFQTLSISGRFFIKAAEKRFLLLRVITGLRNAEIYLKLRYIISRQFAVFAIRNFMALSTQFCSKLLIIFRFLS